MYPLGPLGLVQRRYRRVLMLHASLDYNVSLVNYFVNHDVIATISGTRATTLRNYAYATKLPICLW